MAKAKIMFAPDSIPIWDTGVEAIVDGAINTAICSTWADFWAGMDVTPDGQAAIVCSVVPEEGLPYISVGLEEVFIKGLAEDDYTYGYDTLASVAASLARCAAHVQALSDKRKAEEGAEPDGSWIDETTKLRWSNDEQCVVWSKATEEPPE